MHQGWSLTRELIICRRFFPTNKDIWNNMYQEWVALQFSALDRKHLDALTGQRKKDSPGDAFFYRPHSRNSDDKEEMMMIAGLKPKKTTHQMRFLTLHHQLLRTRLLFCHQTVKQMELLRKYTNEMCLMMPLIAPQNYQLSLICLTHNFKLLAADWQPCPVKV